MFNADLRHSWPPIRRGCLVTVVLGSVSSGKIIAQVFEGTLEIVPGFLDAELVRATLHVARALPCRELGLRGMVLRYQVGDSLAAYDPDARAAYLGLGRQVGEPGSPFRDLRFDFSD